MMQKQSTTVGRAWEIKEGNQMKLSTQEYEAISETEIVKLKLYIHMVAITAG